MGTQPNRIRALGIGLIVIGAATLLVAIAAPALSAEATVWRQGVADPLQSESLLASDPSTWVEMSRWVIGAIGISIELLGFSLLRVSARLQGADAPLGFAAIGATGGETGPHELVVSVRPVDGRRVVSVTGTHGEQAEAVFEVADAPGRAGHRLRALFADQGGRLMRPGRKATERYGAELFAALFPGEVREVYERALDAARRESSSLRVVLDLDADQQAADLPWEFLYDRGRASFIAMSRETSLVRQMNHGVTRAAPERIEVLRMLVMGAGDLGPDPLTVRDECDTIVAALDGRCDVEVYEVDGSTLDALRVAVADVDPHVLHFAGHGQWYPDDDEGVLLLADARGRPTRVTGRDLGVILVGSSVRLALLNSCEGARTSRSDRFAGVAASLVAQGVPAAIGMQYRIADDAAALFGTELLVQLARTGSVDMALTEARMAVFSACNAYEWATPVLLSRVGIDDVITWWPSDVPALRPSATTTGLRE